MADWQTPRGTRDFLPAQMKYRSELFAKIRSTFESYGYGEVCTPAFEDFALLSKKSGPSIEEEIYSFEDKGGRKLGLRFDLTIPAARIVASNSTMPKPIKLYYIGNMWRYDRPQAGRYREFWQAGMELIGPKGENADAEALAVASAIVRTMLDKKFTLRVGSRITIDRLAEEAGVPSEKRVDVLRSIDKLAKIGEENVVAEMLSKDIPKKAVEKFFSLIKKTKSDPYLDAVIEKAKKLGVENAVIDLTITRGLDYYTGFVFETYVEGSESLGSVCSGGRYDTMIKAYGGEDLPATGFALGFDRLLDVTGYPEEYSPVKAFVAPVNDEAREACFEIADTLRKSGVSSETDMMNRNLKKQFEYMNSKNIPFAVILGPKEIEEKKATVRNMKTGEEKRISLKDLANALK